MVTYEEYKAARERVFACAGWRINGLRERLRYSYYTFNANWKELEGWFDRVASPQGAMVAAVAIFDQERRYQFVRELERLLHNFSAGAKSLADHTRVLHVALCKYRDIDAQAQKLVDEHFASNELTQFVIKLRDYLLHYSPISAQYSLQWQGLDFSAPFVFRKAALLQWEGWKVHAKRFIEESGDKIEIRKTLADYHAHTKRFYDLLADRHDLWFSVERAEMDRLFAIAVELEKQFEGKNGKS